MIVRLGEIRGLAVRILFVILCNYLIKKHNNMAIEKLPFPQGGKVQKDAAFEFGKGEDIIPKGFIPNGILRTSFSKDKIESDIKAQRYLYI